MSKSALPEAKPSLYLITFFANNCFFGGAAIVREILFAFQTSFQLNWLYSDEFLEINSLDFWIEKNVYSEPIKIPRKRKYLYTIIDYYLFYLKMPMVAYGIKRRLKQNDVVWIVLENKMIPLAFHMSRIIKNKLHISIHDDCRTYYSNYKFIGNNKIDLYLKTILQRADSIDMIGDALLKEYNNSYHVNGVVYRRGVNISRVFVKRPSIKAVYKLLFVGTSYSNKNWITFIEKISLFKCEFEILILGKVDFVESINERIVASKNIKIINGGIVPDNEIEKIASGCDFAIFFFDDMNEHLLKFSISTKLTQYARLGLPMLAIISAQSQLYELFIQEIAFNIEQKKQEDFLLWITHFSEENYLNYFKNNFDDRKMLENIKSCKAFM